MAVTEEQVRRVEVLAEHLGHAHEVLDAVRELWRENAELRAQVGSLRDRHQGAVAAYGRSFELVRSIDSIVKTAPAQHNYEDFLQPHLRVLHDRIMRGAHE